MYAIRSYYVKCKAICCILNSPSCITVSPCCDKWRMRAHMQGRKSCWTHARWWMTQRFKVSIVPGEAECCVMFKFTDYYFDKQVGKVIIKDVCVNRARPYQTASKFLVLNLCWCEPGNLSIRNSLSWLLWRDLHRRSLHKCISSMIIGEFEPHRPYTWRMVPKRHAKRHYVLLR